MDYFAVFGLPRRLNLDAADLEQRFHTLSRKHHPDRFMRAPEAERTEALRMSSIVNDAYRSLRDLQKRTEHLVSLYGMRFDGGSVDAGFLAEVFEINEQLDEINTARRAGQDARIPPDLQQTIRDLRQRLDGELSELRSRWDGTLDAAAGASERQRLLDQIRDALNRDAYVRNLERELPAASG